MLRRKNRTAEVTPVEEGHRLNRWTGYLARRPCFDWKRYKYYLVFVSIICITCVFIRGSTSSKVLEIRCNESKGLKKMSLLLGITGNSRQDVVDHSSDRIE